MGVDCRLTIPAAARLRDVADVAAALLGAPMVKHDLGRGSYSAHVNGITYHVYQDMPECVHVNLPLSTGLRSFLYHYEWSSSPGDHGIMPRSYSANIALCVALCDFFGGSVDYADCDDSDENYRVPAKTDLHEQDGDPWHAFQDRKLAVRPLTRAELNAYRSVAGYKE